MGSLVSPIVANLYMKYFEKKALSTTFTPRQWMRYVDDTFVIQQEGQMQTFLEQINKVDPAINFTVEGNQENVTIPFLDTLVKQKQSVPYLSQCIGNLSTLISSYSGIATII